MNTKKNLPRIFEVREYPEKDLTERIIGAAIEVYKHLGPGLLESVYQACMARELSIRGISFEQEKVIPVQYKGIQIDCGYRLDFLVENKVIVELKAVDELTGSHNAQLLTYLRVTDCKIGLLINFNQATLRDGLKRLIL